MSDQTPTEQVTPVAPKAPKAAPTAEEIQAKLAPLYEARTALRAETAALKAAGTKLPEELVKKVTVNRRLIRKLEKSIGTWVKHVPAPKPPKAEKPVKEPKAPKTKKAKKDTTEATHVPEGEPALAGDQNLEPAADANTAEPTPTW